MALGAASQADIVLVLGGPGRGASRVDWPPVSETPGSIGSAAEALGGLGSGHGPVALCGGEITLRQDLPELIERAAGVLGSGVGLYSDAWSLADKAALEPLQRAGLARVTVPFHSGRADAHDWLSGHRGAAQRTTRGLRRLLEARLDVEAEVVVTRPTAPHLEETVLVLSRLGVRRVTLRRIARRGAAEAEFVTLSPRFGLLEPYVEAAVRAADRLGVEIKVRGFPRCALGTGAARAISPAPVYVSADAALAERFQLDGERTAGPCQRCPGGPICAGAPLDYIERFGWTELRSLPVAPAAASVAGGVDRTDAAGDDIVPPPPRAGRPPATRVAFSVVQSLRPTLAGDPLVGLPNAAVVPSQRFSFRAPSEVACASCGDHGVSKQPEPTRGLRRRLVAAAQERPARFRIASAGSLAHPEWMELVRETKRLAFPRVELVCEGSALGALTKDEFHRLRHVARVDIALYGPDAASHDAHTGRPGAFERALAGVSRWHEVSGLEVGSFAVLHDETAVGAYARRWASGELPGTPAFRLSERGASLAALAGAAAALDPGPAQAALQALLPACLVEHSESVVPAPAAEPIWADEVETPGPPSGSDRFGRFLPCKNAPGCSRGARCPGIAVGWSLPEAGQG